MMIVFIAGIIAIIYGGIRYRSGYNRGWNAARDVFGSSYSGAAE